MLRSEMQHLDAQARQALREEHFAPARGRASWQLDVRYQGQAYELTIPFTDDFPAHFDRAHEKAYGYAHGGRALEVVNLRVRLTIPTPKPSGRRTVSRTSGKLSNAVIAVKPVWFDSRFWETPLNERTQLAPGFRLQGPAIIVEYSSTTVVPPDFVCVADKHQNLVLRSIRSGEKDGNSGD